MLHELTTEGLLRRCRKRPPDEAAWQEFVRRYHSVITVNVVKAFHMKVGQEIDRRPQFPEHSIDDLVQAVYFRLIDDRCRVLNAFYGQLKNSFPCYLAMISTNVVKDHFREVKAGKRPKITFSLDELLEDGAEGGFLRDMSSDIDGNPSPSGTREFKIEDLDAVLTQSLPRVDRDRNILIFKLRHLDGLTLEEIRNTLKLEMSPRGIGSMLTRINARIRRAIQK